MPKPKYLPPDPIEVTLCWDCEHFDRVVKIVRVRDEKRYIARCSLHGIEIGRSSATCADGTNVKRFGKRHVEPMRSATGWEDY